MPRLVSKHWPDSDFYPVVSQTWLSGSDHVYVSEGDIASVREDGNPLSFTGVNQRKIIALELTGPENRRFPLFVCVDKDGGVYRYTASQIRVYAPQYKGHAPAASLIDNVWYAELRKT